MPIPMSPGSSPVPPEMPGQVSPTPMPDATPMPGDVSSQAPGGVATDEQKQQLVDLIAQIRSKMAESNANKASGSNQADQARMEALKEVFGILQASGVDLSDPNAVQSFIDQLRSFNPDLAQMFEDSMVQLLDEGGQSSTPGPQMQNDLNVPPNNEAIPQNL